jgi:hypothetical protein
MAHLQLTQVPIAKTGMLIRKPETRFLELSSTPTSPPNSGSPKAAEGSMLARTQVRWDWEIYNVSVQVTPKIIEPDRRIVIERPAYSGPTKVEWIFAPVKDGAFVNVAETGFTGDGDQLVKYVADSTQGFTLLLAGLKALLEHGVKLNLTADRYPKGVEHH